MMMVAACRTCFSVHMCTWLSACACHHFHCGAVGKGKVPDWVGSWREKNISPPSLSTCLYLLLTPLTSSCWLLPHRLSADSVTGDFFPRPSLNRLWSLLRLSPGWSGQGLRLWSRWWRGGQEPELTHIGASSPGQLKAFSGLLQPVDHKHTGQQQSERDTGITTLLGICSHPDRNELWAIPTTQEDTNHQCAVKTSHLKPWSFSYFNLSFNRLHSELRKKSLTTWKTWWSWYLHNMIFTGNNDMLILVYQSFMCHIAFLNCLQLMQHVLLLRKQVIRQ